MSGTRDKIMKLAGTYLKDIVEIVICHVDSVDKDNRVCDCTPIGGDASTLIPSVQLCAENDNGFLVFPSVGSTVIVGLSTRNTAFVIQCSGLDNVQFMDGSFGGMIKLLDPIDPTAGILAHMNVIESKIDALITAINVWAPVGGDGGAALKTALTAWLSSSINQTVRSDIENTLITQGK